MSKDLDFLIDFCILEGFFEGVAQSEEAAHFTHNILPGTDLMPQARQIARTLAIKSGFLQPMGGKP